VTARRELQPGDLDELSQACGERPPRIFQLMERLTADVIGHRLFTIMRFDPKGDEVERVYTSMPAVYPVGGRKKKRETAWSDRVLRDMRVFRANTPDAIREAFEDHATIASLGLGSILNVPIVRNPMRHHPGTVGWCVGTMNLLHETGWYTEHDEATGAQLEMWLAPALTFGWPSSE
jgi:hypothetical protein